MSYNPTRFFGPQTLVPLPTNPIKVFANKGIIKSILITNLTSGIVRYSIYLAPAGSDAQDWNKIYPEQFIGERTTENKELSLVVNPGDKLYMTGAIPNSLIATVSGVEVIS
jgi:hypothetical protein